MENNFNIPKSDKKRVVIIGGGFAGINIVKDFKDKDYQIVLIDKNNYHYFQPLLYQVATSALEPTSICFPLRGIFRKYKNFHFIMSEVVSIDTSNNIVSTKDGDITFDYLVIAAGTDTNFYGIKSIEDNSLTLKSVPEALALRNRIYLSLEKASKSNNDEEKQSLLNFIIVGGGATGVELAGALSELKRKVIPRDFPEIDKNMVNIILLNAGDRLLEAFPDRKSVV